MGNYSIFSEQALFLRPIPFKVLGAVRGQMKPQKNVRTGSAIRIGIHFLVHVEGNGKYFHCVPLRIANGLAQTDKHTLPMLVHFSSQQENMKG